MRASGFFPQLARHCAVVALAAAAGIASAAQCDALLARKKITVIVPYKPGGGYDAYARVFAPALQDVTGARVVVSNIAGANGTSGMKAVAAVSGDAIRLGLFDLRGLQAARLEDPSLPPTSEFVALGSFGSLVGVWASRVDAGDILERDTPLTMPMSAGFITRVTLPMQALGREFRTVRGYSGNADRWLALLRGEVDVMNASSDAIARFTGTAPGTRAILVLSDAPSPLFPGVAYIAGKGGLIDQRTVNLDPATRRQRMELATLAAELSTTIRTVVIGSKVAPQLRACLETAVGTVLFDKSFQQAAAQQKLPVEPARGPVVREQIARVEKAMKKNEALLKRMATGS